MPTSLTRFVGGRLRSDDGVRCRLGSALACAERFAPQSGADHDPTTPNVGSLAMTDPILKKAMEKRDAALRGQHAVRTTGKAIPSA
jgi:hypothetical protein